MREMVLVNYVFLASEFASDIRANRLACGMTQAELGEAFDFTGYWISQIERGLASHLTIDKFLSICNLLDLHPCDYYRLQEDK